MAATHHKPTIRCASTRSGTRLYCCTPTRWTFLGLVHNYRARRTGDIQWQDIVRLAVARFHEWD